MSYLTKGNSSFLNSLLEKGGTGEKIEVCLILFFIKNKCYLQNKASKVFPIVIRQKRSWTRPAKS